MIPEPEEVACRVRCITGYWSLYEQWSLCFEDTKIRRTDTETSCAYCRERCRCMTLRGFYLNRKIDALPVVEDAHLVGVMTSSDILRAFLEED